MVTTRRSQAILDKRKAPDVPEDSEEEIKPDINLIDVSSDELDSDLDDSDDSDDDVDDERVEGNSGECEYEEDEEGFPKCTAYDRDFEQVGNDLTSIPLAIIDIIEQCGCSTKRVQTCLTNAKKLAAIPPSKREKICLLGNTGSGRITQ